MCLIGVAVTVKILSQKIVEIAFPVGPAQQVKDVGRLVARIKLYEIAFALPVIPTVRDQVMQLIGFVRPYAEFVDRKMDCRFLGLERIEVYRHQYMVTFLV